MSGSNPDTPRRIHLHGGDARFPAGAMILEQSRSIVLPAQIASMLTLIGQAGLKLCSPCHFPKCIWSTPLSGMRLSTCLAEGNSCCLARSTGSHPDRVSVAITVLCIREGRYKFVDGYNGTIRRLPANFRNGCCCKRKQLISLSCATARTPWSAVSPRGCPAVCFGLHQKRVIPLLHPILDRQVRYSCKLSGIGSHQHCPGRGGMSCNQQIVWANWRARSFQASPDLCVPDF